MASVWPLHHKGLIGGSAAEMVVLLEGSSLLPRLRSLTGQRALGNVLVVTNFFNLRMIEAAVFSGTFNAADIFWDPSPDLRL